jgi:hypothetical protein
MYGHDGSDERWCSDERWSERESYALMFEESNKSSMFMKSI